MTGAVFQALFIIVMAFAVLSAGVIVNSAIKMAEIANPNNKTIGRLIYAGIGVVVGLALAAVTFYLTVRFFEREVLWQVIAVWIGAHIVLTALLLGWRAVFGRANQM